MKRCKFNKASIPLFLSIPLNPDTPFLLHYWLHEWNLMADHYKALKRTDAMYNGFIEWSKAFATSLIIVIKLLSGKAALQWLCTESL